MLREDDVVRDEDGQFLPQEIDLERPSVARVYDYYLGGEANWAVDRAFGDRVLDSFPMLRDIATANRFFLHRVVRHLMRRGVRQFVDVGSGVPTAGNTHQIADEMSSDASVVYIDNDPVAVAHSRLLLDKHGDDTRHTVLDGDLRAPERLWGDVLDTGLIDPDEPTALLLIAVLHVQQRDARGDEIGAQVVARLRDQLPAGSYLAVSHATTDDVPDDSVRRLNEVKEFYDSSSSPIMWRSREEIGALLGGFAPIEPGLCWTPQWHPEEASPKYRDSEFADPSESVIWAGVGRKD